MKTTHSSIAALTVAALLLLAGGTPDAVAQSKVDPLEMQSTELQRVEGAVSLEQAARPLQLEVQAEFSYMTPEGDQILDVREEYFLPLQLLILDADGRPVRDVLPQITPEGRSRFVSPGDDVVTDEYGTYIFQIQGGTMGEERLKIVVDDAELVVYLNVISKRASNFGWLEEIEGVLDWGLLLQADVTWNERSLSATFPDEVVAMNGTTVKLAGFMLPLETKRKQDHFVLASHPPGCFFHVPGGPAGSVEVFAKKSLDLSLGPLVLEGRFEAVEESDNDVLYRLHDARALSVTPPAK